jgi:TolB-like protein/DNA-binding winged helix-turn-helix (wHTH) protein/Flp pilus assembly protein TadD
LLQAAKVMKSLHFYDFDVFRLDPDERVLLRNGQPLSVPPKDIETLIYLVERRGHIVEKDELLEKVWAGVFVEEGNLARRISNLRSLLGDGAEGRTFIDTVPRRGYRFVAEVKEIKLGVESPSANAPVEKTAAVAEVRKPHRMAWTVAAVLAAAVLASFLTWQHLSSESTRASSRVMLVVLPVQNLSGNPDREILSDGLTEELISQLGSLNPQRLGVIARTSSMSYKSTTKRVDEIAKDLAVNYVLEASLRESGNQLRVTAQLIRTSDQTHVWAHDYDRTLRDVVALDDDISRAIAREIKLELAPEGNARLARSARADLESRELYLQGRYFWNQRSKEGLEKGLAFFEKAAEKDPSSALAYAGIADAYNMLLFYGYAPGAVSILRARSAAQKAVELDDSLAEGHAALGYVNFLWLWDWPEAERQFHRAAELNYNYLSGHHWHALYLSAMGRHKEAIEEIHIAQKLDPLSRIVGTAAGYIQFYARDYDEAERASKAVLAQDPNFMAAHAVLGQVYEQKHAYPEAIGEFQRALELSGGESPNYIGLLGNAYAVSGDRDAAQHEIDKLDDLGKRLPFLGLSNKALIYAGLGDREKAMQFLQAARSQNDASLIWIRVQPQFENLRSESRFQQLLSHQGGKL